MNPFLLQMMGSSGQEEEDPYRWREPGVEEPNPFLTANDEAPLIPPAPPELQQDTIIPPKIMGADNIFSPEGTVMGEYQNWLERRPQLQEASKGKKILAGVLGFLTGLKDPEAGARTTRMLLRGGYDQNVADWEREGKSLGEVGKLQQDFGETRRKQLSDVMGFEENKQRVGATKERTKAMVESEKNRHQTAMTNAKTTAERATETRRHNKVMESIAQQNINIDKQDSATRKQNADTYKDKVGVGKPTAQAEVRRAQSDATIEVLAEYPEFEEFFERSESDPRVIYPKPGLSLSEDQRQKYDLAVQLIRKKAQQRLQDPFGVDDIELGEPTGNSMFDQTIPPRRGAI